MPQKGEPTRGGAHYVTRLAIRRSLLLRVRDLGFLDRRRLVWCIDEAQAPTALAIDAISHLWVVSTEPRPLAVLLSYPDSDAVVGGLYGSTWMSYLYVNLLFVPEKMRGAGVGRKLMMEAEAEAIRRGCRAAALDTFSFQARGFYERLGYSVFGTLHDYPPGHSRFYLAKRLVGSAPP